MPAPTMADGMSGAVPPPEEDLYESATEETGDSSEDSEESEESASKGALLPLNLFNGKPEVGDTITLKVDAIFDNEVEASLVSAPTQTKNSRPSIEDDLAEAAT